MSAPGIRCTACRASCWRELEPGDTSFGLFECVECLTLHMQVERPKLAELYDSYYAGENVKRLADPWDAIWQQLRRRKAAGILAELGPGPKRILDVGCERGELLEALRRLGAEVRGTQLSRSAAEYARRRFAIDVFVGELGDAPFANERFDAVLMINVLEHLPDPDGYAALVARLLGRGGIFWIELPNVRSLTARVAKKRWLHADPLHHFWGFSPGGLFQLLDRHGFRVERIDHLSAEHGLIGTIQTLLNYLPGPRNVLLGLLTDGLARRPRPLALQAIHVCVGVLLLVPSVAITLIETLVRRGQVITLVARRA